MDDAIGGTAALQNTTTTPTLEPAELTPAQKLTRIRFELAAQSFERDEVIVGLLIGLLTGQHVLILGPPGTDKSRLARMLCSRLEGARVFQRLCTRHTQPEELFGPLDVAALDRGEYRRITTGRLPEAEIVFLDEVFKGSSVILNTLLEAMNERTFNDGTETRAIPLRLCIGASNELPNSEDGLGAFYDRFLLRYVVGYLQRETDFDAMLRLPRRSDPPGAAATMLTAEDLAMLVDVLRRVEIPPFIFRRVQELRKRLITLGITVSDRRWRDSVEAIRAHALLHHRQIAAVEDLVVLSAICWSDPDQLAAALKVLQQDEGFVVARVRTIGMHVQAVQVAVQNTMMPWPEARVKLSGLQYELDRVLQYMDAAQQVRLQQELLMVRSVIAQLRSDMRTARAVAGGSANGRSSIGSADELDEADDHHDLERAMEEAAAAEGGTAGEKPPSTGDRVRGLFQRPRGGGKRS